MRFVLLVGCLTLCACAAVLTMRLRNSLSRKLDPVIARCSAAIASEGLGNPPHDGSV
jgi:hypothetical protein